MAVPVSAPACQIPFAHLTHSGTERPGNEDACGALVESPTRVLVAVADGVSGMQGGEVASRTAIDVMLRAFHLSPSKWGVPKRLYRAVQQANIEIYDRALIVTELRGMSTTLTAVVLDGGMAYAAHVGDSRLYLVRGDRITQKTQDHTVTADRRRIGLLSAKGAQNHPDRSTLTRSLGRELIAAVDRIEFPVAIGDVLLLCSDGLYNVLADEDLRTLVAGRTPDTACHTLVDAANARGAPDNVTAAVLEATIEPPESRSAFRGSLARLLGR